MKRTPLHMGCYGGHLSVVRMLLLEFGADVNSRDSQNNTPLNDAALGGCADVVCALITEFGCSPQVRGFKGRTLLHQACQKGHSPLIDVLHSEFGLSLLSTDNATDDDGDTPLHYASCSPNPVLLTSCSLNMMPLSLLETKLGSHQLMWLKVMKLAVFSKNIKGKNLAELNQMESCNP